MNLVTPDYDTPLFSSTYKQDRETTKYILLHGGVMYQKPRNVMTGGGWVDETQEKVRDQIPFVLSVVEEIKEEYKNSYSKFILNLPPDSPFCRISNDVGKIIMSYWDYGLHKNFLDKWNMSVTNNISEKLD